MDLDRRTVIFAKGSINLTWSEAAIMHELVRELGKVVRAERLISALYGGSEPDHPGVCLRVFICGLRKKLAAVDFEIPNYRDGGYELRAR